MRKSKVLLLLMPMACVLSGCAGDRLSRLELDYGTSFNLERHGQILNIDAERNLEPVEVLDGIAASAAMDEYRKSFEKPAPTTVYSVSVPGLKTK